MILCTFIAIDLEDLSGEQYSTVPLRSIFNASREDATRFIAGDAKCVRLNDALIRFDLFGVHRHDHPTCVEVLSFFCSYFRFFLLWRYHYSKSFLLIVDIFLG